MWLVWQVRSGGGKLLSERGRGAGPGLPRMVPRRRRPATHPQTHPHCPFPGHRLHRRAAWRATKCAIGLRDGQGGERVGGSGSARVSHVLAWPWQQGSEVGAWLRTLMVSGETVGVGGGLPAGGNHYKKSPMAGLLSFPPILSSISTSHKEYKRQSRFEQFTFVQVRRPVNPSTTSAVPYQSISTLPTDTHHTIKMQFSIVSIIAALAAVSTAQYVAPNGTTYPTGTGGPSGTLPSNPTASIPFTGAAPIATGAGSAMALLVAAGGAALVS